MNDDIMTVEEAARELGMSVAGIRRRILGGHMQARRIGARVLVIPAAEVERAKAEGRRRPGPPKGVKYKPRGGESGSAQSGA